MKIVFCSNFLNHHQLPFSLEMCNKENIEYYFIATEKIPEERILLGYENMNDKYPFVIKAYENQERAINLCNESDVVIIGSAPDYYIEKRLEQNKLTLRYNERIFKRGRWRIINPSTIRYMLKHHVKYKNKNLYMLCASAYTAKDFSLLGAYKNKCYKWGYFPKCEIVNIDKIIEKKANNDKVKLIWVARFLKWKHPELVIEVAKKLVKNKYDFEITMIGTGKLFDKIKRKIEKENLTRYIKLTGAIQHNNVRQYMKESNIFLFTSDRGEGWGAVLNEAMNSGCAVIANEKIGAVPYLIKNNINGITYKNKRGFFNSVIELLEDRNKRDKIAKKAYYTIRNTWNEKEAANNLIKLSENLLKGIKIEIKEGPCSIDRGIL